MKGRRKKGAKKAPRRKPSVKRGKRAKKTGKRRPRARPRTGKGYRFDGNTMFLVGPWHAKLDIPRDWFDSRREIWRGTSGAVGPKEMWIGSESGGRIQLWTRLKSTMKKLIKFLKEEKGAKVVKQGRAMMVKLSRDHEFAMDGSEE